LRKIRRRRTERATQREIVDSKIISDKYDNSYYLFVNIRVIRG